MLGSVFDLDAEYEKDGLEGVRKAISIYGQKHISEFVPEGAENIQ